MMVTTWQIIKSITSATSHSIRRRSGDVLIKFGSNLYLQHDPQSLGCYYHCTWFRTYSSHTNSSRGSTFSKGVVLLSCNNSFSPKPVKTSSNSENISLSNTGSKRDTNPYEASILRGLIDAKNLKQALLVCYRIDAHFLSEHFPRDIPLVVLKNKAREASESTDDSFLRLNRVALRIQHAPSCYTSRVHAKFMLLYFADFLRVVIGSGDMVVTDWYKTDSICYVQDFPLDYDYEDTEKGILFRNNLQDIMNKLEIGHRIPESLNNFDFRLAKGWLVSSVPGIHVQENLSIYGHPALANIIYQQKLASSRNWRNFNVHYMCTALGKLTLGWLAEFRSSAFGFKPRIVSRKLFSPFSIKLYFPTASSVKQLNINEKDPFRSFFNNSLIKSFLKTILHSLPASRSKILASLPITSDKSRTKPSEEMGDSGWVYCGSHNFSASAWGKLIQLDEFGEEITDNEANFTETSLKSGDILNGSPKLDSNAPPTLALSITNYELGIVLPLDALNETGLDLYSLFNSARPYSSQDVPHTLDVVTTDPNSSTPSKEVGDKPSSKPPVL